MLWALEDVELHEAHQLSALMELTFQQWEGLVGQSGVKGVHHACLHACSVVSDSL